MKQLILLFSLIAIGLSGCKKQELTASITGYVAGLQHDTIYLYSADEFTDFILPVPVHDQRFSAQVYVDTLSTTTLMLQPGVELPLFLEKQGRVSVTVDMANPNAYLVEGGFANNQLRLFNQSLAEEEQMNDSIARDRAEAYISLNHKSPINLYLLERYFVRDQQLDYPRVKRLIEMLDGTLKDRLYVEELQELLLNDEKTEVGKYAPAFNLFAPDGKRFSRSDFKDNYLLITFWASWNEPSKVTNDSLKRIAKRYKVKTVAKEDPAKKKSATTTTTAKKPVEEGLSMLSISLDVDKEAWEAAIDNDTLKWNHVYDPKSWNSGVVKQFAVHQIPYQLLLDSKGKIVARGLAPDSLNTKLQELIKKK